MLDLLAIININLTQGVRDPSCSIYDVMILKRHENYIKISNTHHKSVTNGNWLSLQVETFTRLAVYE